MTVTHWSTFCVFVFPKEATRFGRLVGSNTLSISFCKFTQSCVVITVLSNLRARMEVKYKTSYLWGEILFIAGPIVLVYRRLNDKYLANRYIKIHLKTLMLCYFSRYFNECYLHFQIFSNALAKSNLLIFMIATECYRLKKKGSNRTKTTYWIKQVA